MIKDTKSIDAKTIAKYFIGKGNVENKPVTNKKLQKLLYYSQAWYVVYKGKPLFKDEIEAWVHGPSVRDVYTKYKDHGFDPIKISIDKKEIAPIKGDIKKLLDRIWEVYGKFDADYLELLTHKEEPWQEARKGLDNLEKSTNTINLSSMKRFYSNMIKDGNPQS